MTTNFNSAPTRSCIIHDRLILYSKTCCGRKLCCQLLNYHPAFTIGIFSTVRKIVIYDTIDPNGLCLKSIKIIKIHLRYRKKQSGKNQEQKAFVPHLKLIVFDIKIASNLSTRTTNRSNIPSIGILFLP